MEVLTLEQYIEIGMRNDCLVWYSTLRTDIIVSIGTLLISYPDPRQTFPPLNTMLV